MSLFVDQMLVSLSDQTALTQLLDPAGDVNHDRMRALIGSMYDTPHARIHEVRSVQISRVERARPLFSAREKRGTWTQTTPDYARTDVQWEDVDRLTPLWVDVSADLSVTLVLEIDSGEVESILTTGIENITSLADFRSRFRFLDLDAYLQEHGISNVQQLRDRFELVLTEVRMRQPPVFDPNDPANRRRYAVGTAILIRDTLDVSEALRAAKLARAVLRRTTAYRESAEADFETTSPYTPVVIFPSAALQPSQFTEPQLRALFATEGIVAIFVQP